MARNKNSTALFDVIHAAKKPPKASPSASIPTPRWWGKDKNLGKKVPPPAPAASTENVGKQKSWLSAAKKSVVPPAIAPVVETARLDTPAADACLTTVSTPVETVAGPTTEVGPKSRFIDRFVNRPHPAVEMAVEPVADAAEPTATPVEQPTGWTDSEFVQITPTTKPAPRSAAQSNIDTEPVFKLDPGRKEFLFRLSYGGIIAIGFIFLLALGIAFIAGKRTAMETADVDSLPATRGPSTGTGLLVAVAPVKSDSDVPASNTVLNIDQHHTRPAITLGNPPIPAAPPLPLNKTREIGLNYVIIQSYDQQELAQKACDFVNQAGTQCTVVQGPSEWAPRDWYSVIGLRAFSKGDSTLEDYKRNVRAIGLKFSNKPLNQFDPKAYTWRADSDPGQQ